MLCTNTQKIIQCLQRSSNVSIRSYAQPAFTPLTKPLEDVNDKKPKKTVDRTVQITKLENGIKVASCDHGGAVSKIAFALQGGSRFESIDQLGISHIYKNAAFLTNGERSHLSTVRETQLLGASLECSSSREVIVKTGMVLRTNLAELVRNIAPSISSPVFLGREVGQAIEQCKGDLATLDCTAKNLELLHKAAYRNGLGNSVYCDELSLGNFSEGNLNEFAERFHVGEGLTIVGTDVNHDELVLFSNNLLAGLPCGVKAVAEVQRYHGGEIRAHTSNGLTYASLVGPGAELCSGDIPAFAVLQRILGQESSIKWGSNSSRLTRAASGATRDAFMISSLNISYSDAALFGVHAVSTPSAIGSILTAAVKEVADIANGEISPEEITCAKNQVKSDILMTNESVSDHFDDLITQVIFTGGCANQNMAFEKIDAVSDEQVTGIANRLFNTASLAITGDICNAPYLDELL